MTVRENLDFGCYATGVRHALSLAHRGYVLENGRVVLEGSGRELLGDERLKKAYLGL